MSILPIKKPQGTRPTIRRGAGTISPEDAANARAEFAKLKKKYPWAVQLPPVYGKPGKPKPQNAPPAQQPPNIITIVIIAFIAFTGTLFIIFAALPNPNINNPSNPGTNNNPGSPTTNTPTVTPPASSGHCTSNSDCAAFGNKNCGGNSALAKCGSDTLCHCCLSLRADSCITCAEIGESTCAANSGYCEQGACVFKIGGLTSQ